MSDPLVILDRDGVINHDSDDFIKSPAEWRPIDGSLEAIAKLTAAGFIVAVATNQSGVGRGLFDKQTLERIHSAMRSAARQAGGEIDEIVFCPHRPDDECDCRKPAPGLFAKLARHYDMPLAGVPAIGDSLRDIDAAIAAGAKPILVLTGNGEQTAAALSARGAVIDTYPDLLAAATALANDAGDR